MIVDDIRRFTGVVMMTERVILDWSNAVVRALCPLPVPSSVSVVRLST
jgi:hypothetical protein